MNDSQNYDSISQNNVRNNHMVDRRNTSNQSFGVNLKYIKKLEEQSYFYHLKRNEDSYYSKYIKDEEAGWDKIQKKSTNLRSPWICPICSYNNNSDSFVCVVCLTQRTQSMIVDDRREFRIGDLYDVRDIINRWLPAKVVDIKESLITFHFIGYVDEFDEILDVSNSNERNRINHYKTHCNEYGLNRYTKQYYTQERIEKIIKQKIKEIEEKEDLKRVYYIGRKIYFTSPDESITYEFTIIELIKDNNSVNVKYGKEMIYNIPITLLQLNCNDRKKKVLHGGDDDIMLNKVNNSITINTCRKALKQDNVNMIINITNSFISDYNRCTAYSNDDCDNNRIEVVYLL